MQLREIATKLGITELKLEVSQDANGNDTPWLRHWENKDRFAVSVHKDLLAEIKANPTMNLDMDSETRSGAKGDYLAYRLVKPREYADRLSLV